MYFTDETYLSIKEQDNSITITSLGEWTLYHEPEIRKTLLEVARNLHTRPHQKITWDFSNIKGFDSVGVLLFVEFYEEFQKESEIAVIGYTPEQERLYELLMKHKSDEEIPPRADKWLLRVGRSSVKSYREFMEFLEFLGHTIASLFRYFINPRNFRYSETMYHIGQSGMNAMFIIALTSFLVGLVIAYQSAVELARFGADIFIVDMAGVSITRELGPMITAIVVAGRSGSAYTAQIGAMKITEEISAMRTMGFDPYYFLVLPRMIALMIALPLLIFFSDVMGILGSMFAAKMELGISYTQFLTRLQEVLNIKHFWIGIIKGPVFAMLIALIGCFRGFLVSDNTESIGQQTTASVVNSIFFVIAFDALFSIILTEWRI